MPTGSLPRIIQLPNGTYATPDGKGGWAPYSGQLPDGTSAAGDNPNAFKVGDADEISHTWDLIDSINASRDLARKPLATGMPAKTITSIPVIGGLVGQNSANLQVKLGSVAGALRQMGIKQLYEQTGKKGVGSIARNQAEQQALQNSLAPLGYVDQGGHLATGPSPDEATLAQGLDTAQNLFLRHQARLLGMNPDDPNVMQTLSAAIADPTRRAALLGAVKGTSASTGMDTSTPLPTDAVGSGGAGTTTSTDSQAHLNPQVAKIAPQLTQMLNTPKWRMPDSQIIDFVRQHGIDPDSWEQLQKALPNRGKTMLSVDPHFSEPLTGVKKALNAVGTFAPGGIPVGATIEGAGDAYTLGLAPDIAATIHGVTGVGPTRDDVVQARDASASEHPAATFIGNAVGTLANPLARGGGIGRTALLSSIYGGASSDDPNVGSRLINAAIGASIGAGTHAGSNILLKGVQDLGRAARSAVAPLVGRGEEAATNSALSRAAAGMPPQDMAAVSENLQNLRSQGVPAPAAAAVNRGGQEFLSRVASSSPAARTAADSAAATFRKGIPQGLEQDFNQAIADAAPEHAPSSAAFLSRPTREIANDVQSMAGREYETGIAPIANEKVTLTPDLTDTLTHERIGGAIKDALSNHKLGDETRAILRGLPSQLKALNIVIPGAKPEVVASMRAKYAEGIPLTVDATRNIATALDRAAAKMQAGSEGAIQLRSLSRDLRGAIGEQYPEFEAVNGRYASRMRAIDAMDAARSHFLAENPEQIDALAKASGNFNDAPNEPEFKGVQGAEPSGEVQPSNRQFALAGAREAATTKAGSGANGSGASLLRQIAEGTNQAARNKMVAGNAADRLAGKAGARATVAEAVDRVASGPNTDQSANWFKLAKYALTTKLTGGAAHYAVARTLAGMPSMSAEDAARVVRVYMDADNADQVVKALNNHYGAVKARNIMARMAAIGTAGASVRKAPRNPPPKPNVIGAPVTGGM